MIRIAAVGCHARLNIGVEGLALGEAAGRAEDDLRRLGGELATRLGSSGLHDHRPALHRPRDVERAANREVRSVKVEHVEFGGIEEYAALHVTHEGVVRSAIPQSGDHVAIFAGAGVTIVVRHVHIPAEVE